MPKVVLTLLFFVVALSIHAGAAKPNPHVFQLEVKQPFHDVYKKLHKALEDKSFYVVFEARILSNMRRFEKEWGSEFNKNKLEHIRSLVICNIRYVNQVANLDPTMLSLCPLRIVIIEKKPVTTVMFVRPTAVAAKSPAIAVIKKLEMKLIEIIQTALK